MREILSSQFYLTKRHGPFVLKKKHGVGKLFLAALLSCAFINASAVTETVEKIENQKKVLKGVYNLHLTSADEPIVNGSVSLNGPDAWLYFDNIKPSDVIANYLDSVKVGNNAFNNGVNGRVAIYGHGAVLMAHGSTFKPLTVYAGDNFSGDSSQYAIHAYHNSLGDFDNAIKSFKLKKGYQATFANESDGSGYSRVFIAAFEDIEIQMPDKLYETVSFIRVFKHQYVSKKGKAGWDPNVINGTTYYDWNIAGDNSSADYEYAAIRQNAGWPSWTDINNKQNITHVLGYNEPDQSDQSNMDLATMLSVWPGMYGSGLRVGSPAYASAWSGNPGLNLFDYVSRLEEENYRVDFIALHCYWGGLSGESWYYNLKDYHDRCGGRPLWITEWNNGANWTTEWWPDDTPYATTNNVNDNLADMKVILNVLDTTSFVERYFLYDWVEDRRAMVVTINDTYLEWVNSGDQKGDWIKDAPVLYQSNGYDVVLTPFGEYYRDNYSQIGYNGKYEIIPGWNYTEPTLSSRYLSLSKSINLTWTDNNGELTKGFAVQKKVNNGSYEDIYNSHDISVKSYVDPLDPDLNGKVTYRSRVLTADGEYLNSNEISVYQTGGSDTIQIGEVTSTGTEWTDVYFSEKFASTPKLIMGIPSFNNTFPMTLRANSVATNRFKFKTEEWDYVSNASWSKEDQIAVVALPEGIYDFGGLQAEVGEVTGVTKEAVSVTFEQPFTTQPVVFATQVSSTNSFGTTVCIENVTTTGFDISVISQQSITSTAFAEKMNFLAIEPGKGSVQGKRIEVVNPEAKLALSSLAIEVDESYTEPAFFASLMSNSNAFATNIRYYLSTSTGKYNLFRQRELSGGLGAAKSDEYGYMIIDLAEGQIINSTDEVEIDNSFAFYPNPAVDVINFSFKTPTQVQIFDLTGKVILDVLVSNDQLNIADLPSGNYLLKAEGKVAKLTKE